MVAAVVEHPLVLLMVLPMASPLVVLVLVVLVLVLLLARLQSSSSQRPSESCLGVLLQMVVEVEVQEVLMVELEQAVVEPLQLWEAVLEMGCCLQACRTWQRIPLLG
jgi:hypothetical protein